VEISLFRVARHNFSCFFPIHCIGLLFALFDYLLGLFSGLVEKLEVVNWFFTSFRVEVFEQISGFKELHETHIDVIFHLPNPLPVKAYAELRTKRSPIPSHQKGEEASLRDVFL
jgi:hypothetical protein